MRSYLPVSLCVLFTACTPSLNPAVVRRVALAPSATRRDDAALDGPTLHRAAFVRAVIDRDGARVAAAHRARAALEDADAARSLPPPEAGAQLWNVPFSRPWDLGRAQMIMVEARQTFTTAGLRGARSAQRVADAEAALAELTAREQSLFARAAEAHAELALTARHHAVHVRHLAVLDAMHELVRARVGASTAGLAGVARVEAERARVLQRLARFDAEHQRARRAANALLRRALDAPLGEVIAPDADFVPGDPEALVREALRLRGELGVAEAALSAARAMRAEARSEAREPMITVGAGAWFDPMMEPGYGLSAMTTLPWLWGGGAARERAASHRAEAAVWDRETRAADVRAEVIDLHARMLTAARALRVIHDRAVPAAQRALDAAQAAFGGGAGSLLEWIDAARMRIEVGDEEADAAAELLRSVSALEARVGATLPRAPLADLPEAP
jgi:outer membrane protein TolC